MRKLLLLTALVIILTGCRCGSQTDTTQWNCGVVVAVNNSWVNNCTMVKFFKGNRILKVPGIWGVRGDTLTVREVLFGQTQVRYGCSKEEN